MAWPMVLMAAGSMIQMFGQAQANAAQSAAEARNAQFLREQAAQQEAATRREMKLQERDQDRLRGAQIGAYASGNVDIGSGSALSFLAEQEAFAIEERAAIRTDGDLRTKLALLRAEDSQSTSDTLGSFQYNVTQGLGTFLSNAGSMYKAGGGGGGINVGKPKKFAGNYGGAGNGGVA